MTSRPKVMDDGRTVTVRVPISIRRRGGRKLVLAPDGVAFTAPPIRPRIDSTMPSGKQPKPTSRAKPMKAGG